ncbi:MAG: hypothetical protein ACR2GY_13105 [Phycisphaerales bacterium]
MIRLTRCIIAALIVGTGAQRACVHADVVVLKDGTTMRCEVVGETADTLTIRIKRGNTWTTESLLRFDVDKLYPEAGDQSDGSGRPTPPPLPPIERESPDGDLIPLHASDALLVARVPLHGGVGGGQKLGDPFFDAALLERCFEECVKQNISIVVLDIDSPGGLVSEMEAICETIIDWHDRLRIIAWPSDALSAAALVTFSCKEVIVRNNSIIGAATIITIDGTDMTALEAKFASPHYARQRNYMDASGHPYDVIAAMSIQTNELWWSPASGFTAMRPADAAAYEQVDDMEGVLTLTGTDAMRFGLAVHQADNQVSLLQAIAADGKAEIVDFQNLADRHVRDAARQLQNVLGQFETYLRGLGASHQSLVSAFEAISRSDQEGTERHRRSLLREIGKLRTAGRMIQRAAAIRGRAALVDVPPEFLDLIEQDAEELAQVASLIKIDTRNSWQEAGNLLGTIARRWQAATQNR